MRSPAVSILSAGVRICFGRSASGCGGIKGVKKKRIRFTAVNSAGSIFWNNDFLIIEILSAIGIMILGKISIIYTFVYCSKKKYSDGIRNQARSIGRYF